MPNNALDQMNMMVVTDMYLMVAIHVFILARNRVFQVMDCSLQSEDFCSDLCCVVF
jgi:hypothetical protein